jgi:hypothetical protein
MSEPAVFKATADKLYANARHTENPDQRLKIILRALELDVAALIVERHQIKNRIERLVEQQSINSLVHTFGRLPSRPNRTRGSHATLRQISAKLIAACGQ